MVCCRTLQRSTGSQQASRFFSSRRTNSESIMAAAPCCGWRIADFEPDPIFVNWRREPTGIATCLRQRYLGRSCRLQSARQSLDSNKSANSRDQLPTETHPLRHVAMKCIPLLASLATLEIVASQVPKSLLRRPIPHPEPPVPTHMPFDSLPNLRSKRRDRRSESAYGGA